MSLYDNEIYRGPPESDPTLAKDTFPYGAEFYIVKPPETTARQDAPATEETAQQERKPAQKKKSRIAKAMKLLASCAATVAVVTTLAVPAKPVPEPVPELPLWPRIVRPYDERYSFHRHVASQNSTDCQVPCGSKFFCLTAKQEDTYMVWNEGFDTYFEVAMIIPNEDPAIWLYFDADPTSLEAMYKDYADMYVEYAPVFGLGQIQTVSGETLYVLGSWYDRAKEESLPIQQIIDNLDEYIQISDTTEEGWDYLYVGDTMYTETNPKWSSTVGGTEKLGWFCLEAVKSTADAAYSEDALICQRRVNGIDWSFYYGEWNTDRVIWAVPAQEDIALGYDYIISGDSLSWQEDWYSIKEWPSWVIEAYNGKLPETWQEKLVDIVDDVIIEYILCNYYLVEQMPGYEPIDIPTDATEVTRPEATEATMEATTEATEVPLTTEEVTEPLSQCEANGHTWVDANYQAPKTCSVCGVTEGEVLQADFEARGWTINITELDTEYDYITTCVNDPTYKTYGKLSLSNYRIFEGNVNHPALEGYEWHAVSVKIRFDDNYALYVGGPGLVYVWEDYYDMGLWDASEVYLETENMYRHSCKVNGIEYNQCRYENTESIWEMTLNPETGAEELTVTFDQYIRIPVGYDGAVIGYADRGNWTEDSFTYEVVDENTLFFRLDGTGAQ